MAAETDAGARPLTISPPKTGLPVEEALPELSAALEAGVSAVLVAPPGAGKTTLAPLWLAASGWATRRILMLEPRRVAARAAAERMASLLGEAPGGRVGYRIRGEAVAGARIEVVTEGILTRMLQSDPSLAGVSAVIFDEFHERSLHADLGLALTLEAQGALREDLRVLVMSATLDAAAVAALMGGAPVVRSEGRAHPVETRWLEKPWRKPDRRGPQFEDAMADLIREAMAAETGDALAFLPGAGEIRRVEAKLGAMKGVDIRPIFGALPFAKQRLALAPSSTRKLVLATAIAETSLTIDGVRIVIDGGRARRARFDPGSGMSRLVTTPVTRAEAEQRRGRAGRTAPGVCYRLWTRGEDGALAAAPAPEIAEADLAGLALELAIWGAGDGAGLAFLDPPPAAALAEARALLAGLGALDAEGRATAHGEEMAATPLHPRLAHMVLTAPGGAAADLAALLEERDILGPGAPADMALRLEALRGRGGPAADPGVRARVRENAARLRRRVKRSGAEAIGATLARAFPDRVAMRRTGEAPKFLLSGGKGAYLAEDDPLAGSRFLVAADLDGDLREARIRLAAPVTLSEIEGLFGDRIVEAEVCEWSRRDRAVHARRRRMLGALALEDRAWKGAPAEAVAAAMLEGVRDLGLQALDWTPEAVRLRARVVWARDEGAELPDWSDEGLMATLEDWLLPALGGSRTAADLKRVDVAGALTAALSWEAKRLLDRLAPAVYVAPGGAKAPVDYGRAQPAAAVRLQEMFGLDEHPTIGPKRAPLLLDLLSPARRPVQSTADLPGFWRSSYADVRKDMRGRYPKHDWPEAPQDAAPSSGPKRRR